jgi:hypothetical protein
MFPQLKVTTALLVLFTVKSIKTVFFCALLSKEDCFIFWKPIILCLLFLIKDKQQVYSVLRISRTVHTVKILYYVREYSTCSMIVYHFTWSAQRIALKGTVSRDFCFRFFSWIIFPQAPEIILGLFEFCHLCQRHRWQIKGTISDSLHLKVKKNYLYVQGTASGQIGSAWEWYHWIGLERTSTAIGFWFLISVLDIWNDFKVLSCFIQKWI